ncbi:MAG: phosphoribosylglycinamide formyltransferase [Halothiobacillus sp.]
MTTTTAQRARVCVLVSGNGSNLQAMIDACARGSVAADIVQVISNRPDAFGLVRAQNTGIPTAILDHKNFPDRAGFDAALADLIGQSQPHWVILAGFMRILTPEFVQRFLGKLINIHPSLLPKYPGLNTHARALEAGDVQHGATVHFVTPTVDAGPVIIQGVLTIQPHESLGSLKARVHRLEHQIYPVALAALVAGDVKFEDARAVWADGASNDSPRQMHT